TPERAEVVAVIEAALAGGAYAVAQLGPVDDAVTADTLAHGEVVRAIGMAPETCRLVVATGDVAVGARAESVAVALLGAFAVAVAAGRHEADLPDAHALDAVERARHAIHSARTRGELIGTYATVAVRRALQRRRTHQIAAGLRTWRKARSDCH